ncbi:MAG: hypothetical protein QM772_15210 [Ottowia sp.]|uniref:hypothetical protein n=1 Tax=Ottowia sp. TaxID=1898956 RepID=UPI0039E686B5
MRRLKNLPILMAIQFYSAAWALECDPNDLTGTWVHQSTENDRTYSIIGLGERNQRSYCEITGTRNFTIQLDAPKNGVNHGIRRSQVNNSRSWTDRGRFAGSEPEREECTSDHGAGEKSIQAKEDVLTFRVTESTEPEDIGDISKATCTMNGKKNQMILKYRESNGKTFIRSYQKQ